MAKRLELVSEMDPWPWPLRANLNCIFLTLKHSFEDRLFLSWNPPHTITTGGEVSSKAAIPMEATPKA